MVRIEQLIRLATVESVRAVQIDHGQTGVSTGAASSVGGGRGSIVGAVAGSIAGQAIENGSSLQPAPEITAKLENGKLRAIVPEVDNQQFQPGDGVRLVTTGGVTRVTR